jgi:hypothetical protein
MKGGRIGLSTSSIGLRNCVIYWFFICYTILKTACNQLLYALKSGIRAFAICTHVAAGFVLQTGRGVRNAFIFKCRQTFQKMGCNTIKKLLNATKKGL